MTATTRGKIVDEQISNYFQMKLLQKPRRIMKENGDIEEIYDQPERSKREDCIIERNVLTLVCKGCAKEVRYLDKPNRETVTCKCGALNTTVMP